MAGFNHESTTAVGDDFVRRSGDHQQPARLPGAHRPGPRSGRAVRLAAASCPPPRRKPAPAKVDDLAQVRVECPELCPRYTARVIRGVKIGPSPAWLSKRLATIGQPAINNVVDITNYVLMECGQPLHAFDLAKLARPADHRPRSRKPAKSSRRSITRRTTLEPGMCVIADAERPVALGGVMGGVDTRSLDRDDRPADRERPTSIRSRFAPRPASWRCAAIRRTASSGASIRKGSIGPAAAAAN